MLMRMYETVKQNETVTIGQNQNHTVQKNRSLKVNKNHTETVKIAKSVTVGTVYTTQVGVAMNTLVGMMQAEEVGLVKKTMVGKNYGITAGEQFQIKVGDSSLILNADGSIVLKGKSIRIEAEKDNTIIGNDVHINPEPKKVDDNDIKSEIAKTQTAIDMIELSANSYINEPDGKKPGKNKANPYSDRMPKGYSRLTDDEINKLGINPLLLHDKKDKSGFYATMYKNDKNGYVVAFRGSESILTHLNDWYNNGKQGIGLNSAQYNNAYKLAQALEHNPRFNDNNMTLTGHSLGGGLASLAGSVTGFPTYTFNASGVHQNTLNRYGVSPEQTGHIQAYYSNKDPLNKVQDNRNPIFTLVGTTQPTLAGLASVTGALPQALGQRIQVDSGGTVFSNHSTDPMEKALEEQVSQLKDRLNHKP